MQSKSKHFFGDEELAAIKKLFESGNTYRYKAQESECAAFEREFSELCGFSKSITVRYIFVGRNKYQVVQNFDSK